MSNYKWGAATASSTAYVTIEGTRGLSDGVTIYFANEDWSAEDLTCYVSLTPDTPTLVKLPVSVTLDSTETWQHLVDCEKLSKCYIPCDVKLSDTLNISAVSISWLSSSFPKTTISSASELGCPVSLFYCVRRTDGTGPRFYSGTYVLTETNI